MHRIVFDIDPVPASRPRVTQYGTYYSEKYDQFRKDMAKLLLGARKKLYAEPLKLDVTFSITIPKSYSQKKRDEMDGTYCVSNIDLDNLEKALYDSMNGVVYEDDKQIVEHTTRKKWVAGRGSIKVEIQIV